MRLVVPAEISGEGQPVGEARHATFEVLDILADNHMTAVKLAAGKE